MMEGQIEHIKGNSPFLLDDPGSVWIVHSGEVALFSVEIESGEAAGARCFLCSFTAGEALFGIASEIQGERQRLVAVAVEDTEIVRISLERAQQDAGLQGWLERWIHKLGTVFAGVVPAGKATLAASETWVQLGTQEHYRPRQSTVVLVEITSGQAEFLGFGQIALVPGAGALPLGGELWVQATEAAELQLVTPDVPRLLEALERFHRHFVQAFDRFRDRALRAQFERLLNRQQRNIQVTEQTLSTLASVLETAKKKVPLEGSPLLTAVGAIGQAMGVVIRPPARSEDLDRLKNPLEAIVRASRIRMRSVAITHQALARDCGPLLAYIGEDKRPVALLRARGGYELFDPLTRRRERLERRGLERLEPYGFMFYRPLPDKALQSLDILRFALGTHLGDLAWIVFTGILAALLGMLVPLCTGLLVEAAVPQASRSLLLQMALGLLASSFGIAAFQLGQQLLVLRVESLADASIQAAVWDRVLNLSPLFFRNYSTGDLNSRIMGIAEIRRKLSGTTLRSVFSGLFSVLNLGMLFYYSAHLAWVAVAVGVFAACVTLLHGWLKLGKLRLLERLKGEIFGLVVQLINGVAKLRVLGAEERAFARWGQVYSRQQRLSLGAKAIEDSLVGFNETLPLLSSGILFWFAFDAIRGQDASLVLSTGAFVAFNVAFGTFIRGVTDLSNALVDSLNVVDLWERAKPILEADTEVDDSKDDPGRLSGRLSLESLSFRYGEEGPMVLKNATIHADPGEFIAIVGPSGCGKSTVFRLLLGFETPSAGTVYYDNQDLGRLDIRAVRRQLGVVLQNGKAQANSIYDNVARGAVLSQEEVWDALRSAGLAEDVAAMPMGLHTVVSEAGGNLSGGQRQRLLIAQALALKPRILLFDEATSALDSRTQATVSQSLDQLQVTRVVIAHRLSTIRNADRIYVMQAGNIIQQGRFEELIAQEGLFSQLAARQMA